MPRKRTGPSIQAPGNPELAKHIRAQELEHALAERTRRRAIENTAPAFCFDQDLNASGASRNLRVKVSVDYPRYEAVIAANDGNRMIEFHEWRLATDNDEIAKYLRWAMRRERGGLTQVKEIFNPIVVCSVPGCGWKGAVTEASKHYMDTHVNEMGEMDTGETEPEQGAEGGDGD